VHAPYPVVDDAYAGLGEPIGGAPHHLGTETVVAEEDVADTGYQNLGRDDTYIRRMRM